MSERLMAEGPVWNGQHLQHNMINMRAFVSRIIVYVCNGGWLNTPEGLVICIKTAKLS